MSRLGIDKDELNKFQFSISVGLLATPIVTSVQLLTIAQLDKALLVSIVCFSVSIPLLGFDAFAGGYELLTKRTVRAAYRGFVSFVGSFLSLIGIGAFFWHFSWWIGLLFTFTSVIALILWRDFKNLSDSQARLGK